MKKISEGNKGIQALAKENPALVEDKFGYDVPGYFMGGMPGVDMGGMPGVDEAVDDAQEGEKDAKQMVKEMYGSVKANKNKGNRVKNKKSTTDS